jgi:hypothetical protein
MFKAPSGRGNSRIQALENIDKPSFDFNLQQQQRTFKKGKAVVEIMDKLLNKGTDGVGKALLLNFKDTMTFISLNRLASEAQKLFLDHMEKPKKREKRTRAEDISVGTAYNHIRYIKEQYLGIAPPKRKKRKTGVAV